MFFTVLPDPIIPSDPETSERKASAERTDIKYRLR
jgi:hypothetical protein